MKNGKGGEKEEKRTLLDRYTNMNNRMHIETHKNIFRFSNAPFGRKIEKNKNNNKCRPTFVGQFNFGQLDALVLKF